MKKYRLAVIVLVGIVGFAQAGYQDVLQSWGGSEPSIPQYSSGSWQWGSDWQAVAKPTPENPLVITLNSNQSVWLGLQNIQVLELHKVVTLNFHAGNIVPVSFKAGYNDGSVVTWDMSLIDSTTTYRQWQGVINPQPGWEWVELKNLGLEAQEIRVSEFSSVCVPEPVSLLFLAVGGLTALRKRK